MAEIVILNKWRGDRDRRPIVRLGEQQARAPADVILFTGVRYERFDDRMDRKAQNHAVRVD